LKRAGLFCKQGKGKKATCSLQIAMELMTGFEPVTASLPGGLVQLLHYCTAAASTA